MNIVVLCGGTSFEREVSLSSAKNICEALRRKGHKAILLDAFLGRNDINDENAFFNIKSVEEEMEIIRRTSRNINIDKNIRREYFGERVIKICQSADIVFMALHGENGENGKVQATFDLYGIKYTGANHISSGMAMNKSISRDIFMANNISIPKGYAIKRRNIDNDFNISELKYPVIVKPNSGGSSIGTFVVENYSEYIDAVGKAYEFDDEIIVEEKITGREFSCGIIGCKPMPVIEVIPKSGFYDYKNKYILGNTNEVCPADVSEKLKENIQNISLKVAKVMGISSYCRVDILTDMYDNCYCIEVNTLPGMTNMSLLPKEAKAMGMDFDSLCEKLIEVSMMNM